MGMRNVQWEMVGEGCLSLKIQQKREQMHKTAKDYGLNSNKTLSISQELDELINNYFRKKLSDIKI